LKRLLSNKRFTCCTAIDETLKQYRTESDSAQMFLSENDYQPHSTERVLLKELYQNYRSFCNEDGYRACGKKTFSERLQRLKYEIIKSSDKYVLIAKQAENQRDIIKDSNKLPF
jgi:putative DNA primase/helicase